MVAGLYDTPTTLKLVPSTAVPAKVKGTVVATPETCESVAVIVSWLAVVAERAVGGDEAHRGGGIRLVIVAVTGPAGHTCR